MPALDKAAIIAARAAAEAAAKAAAQKSLDPRFPYTRRPFSPSFFGLR